MAGSPTEPETLREAIDSRLLDVHTGLPGRIHTYDPVTQTADIELMIRRPLEAADGSTGHEAIPILPNVPIGWFASGGFAMQFPVTKGDGVWVMFSEAAWAEYRTTGELADPGDLRRHDVSYPCAIPVCRPVPQLLTPIGANEAVLDVPSGQVFRVGGTGAQFVALANKVNAELSKIATAFSSFVPGSGGASFNSTYTTAGDVSATKLKAE